MALRKTVRVAIAGLSLLAAGTLAQAESIKIGTLNPVTGPLGPSGTHALQGHVLAVEEINAAGGIKSLGGATLELVNGDSQGNPGTGRTETTRIIDDGAVAVIGAFQSSVTLDASLVAERAGIPFLDPTAVADSLTTRGLKNFLMLTVKSSSGYADQIKFVSELATKLGLEKARVALLYESSDFGQAVAKAQLETIAKHSNLEVVSDIAFEAGSGDLSAQMARVKAANPDILLDASYIVDAIGIARSMARLGMDNVIQVSAGGGIFDPEYLSTLKGIAENKLTLNFWSRDVNPAAVEFTRKYEAKFGTSPTGNSAQSYLATYIVAAALGKAGSSAPAALRDAMLGVTEADVPEQARVMQYGIKFNPQNGYNDAGFALVTQIQDGKHVVVWPDSIAHDKLRLPAKK